jgi:(2Fe-2S) ferredoxin
MLVGALSDAAIKSGLNVEVTTFSCFGRCVEGPNVRFSPGGPFFRGVAAADVGAILSAFVDWTRSRSSDNT